MQRRMRKLVFVFLGTALMAALAESRTPERDEMERVEELAFQIEIDTDEAYVETVRMANPSDEEEEKGLYRLYTLMESASYYYQQVQVSYDASEHTVVGFERLNNVFIEAREDFPRLQAYREHRDLFETIEDTIGNLRFYYVDPYEYDNYPDYDVYPCYPGFKLFLHAWTPEKPYIFRHRIYWHLHPTYAKRFPHRVEYRYGYGRYDSHYTNKVKHGWHRKIVNPKPRVKKVVERRR